MLFAACGSVKGPSGTASSAGTGGQPGCPPGEPSIQTGCDVPLQDCSYSEGGCTHTLRCLSGEWSFESKICNFPGCPTTTPANGAPCTPPALQCLYGSQPVPDDAPCVDASWTEALCDPVTGTWSLGSYDSVCPLTCPQPAPTQGAPCNPTIWPPECSYDVTAPCGAAKQKAVCGPEGSFDAWQLSAPVCGP